MLDGLNRFSKNPVNLDISRSKFDRSHGYKTTFKAGDIIPVYLDEVLPGDTFKLKESYLTRLLTPVVPTMDNCFIDFYFFFVPNRLCVVDEGDEKLWQQICGENTKGFWAQTTEKFVPTFQNSNLFVERYSLAEYFGLPCKIDNAGAGVISLDGLIKAPFVAYQLIYNRWFRDENTQAPVDIYNDQAITTLRQANKFHDYFTSALPAPQKGSSVELPLGTTAPLVTGPNYLIGSDGVVLGYSKASGPAYRPIVTLNPDGQGVQNVKTLAQGSGSSPSAGFPVDTTNLYADLSNATAATVNAVRQAFAIQRMFEKEARGGSRYFETLKIHFGTAPSDSVLQEPEYLGGFRDPINIQQVLQTSGTNADGYLGFAGAYSNSSNVHNCFTKSFTEFGYVLGVAVVRNMQSYCQGVNRMWFRNRKFDFYYPVFSNLGEQAIYNDELFVDGTHITGKNSGVFGYQEAWSEYRYKPSIVCGAFSVWSGDKSALPYTYVNDFASRPVLNSDFMKQDSSNIGRTLVKTDTKDQFLIDVFFNVECTRPMPVYSIPGLIDHH